MDFRHPNKEPISVLLPRRSLLILTGEGRYCWSHSISPRKSDAISGISFSRETRISLTFRKVFFSFLFLKYFFGLLDSSNNLKFSKKKKKKKILSGPCQCSYQEFCVS